MSTLAMPRTGEIGIDGFLQPRRAAFWLLVFFLANGLYSVVQLLLTSYSLVPQAMLASLVAWTLYALPFLLFLRHLDVFQQQSRMAFVLAFAWGGLGAVYLAIPANDAIFSLAAKLGSPEFKGTWGAAIAGPTTEEFLKTSGIILLVLVARTQFLTPLSVVATGAMVGLGFQIVENMVYSTNAALSAINDDQLSPVLSTVLMRGFLCGLWSHSVYSAIAAYGVAQFMFRRHQPMAVRVGWFVAFFALAWALHATWNSPLLSPIQSVGGIFGPLLYIFAKGLPVLLFGVWIWRMALAQQSTYLEQVARHFVPEPVLVSAEERTTLTGLGSRRAHRKALAKSHGRSAARALHSLQQAQLALLLACARHGRGPGTYEAERAVIKARSRLDGRIASSPPP
jgi:RsiW-degrading membrane proteinase PrsW (M82 family)